LQGDCRLGRALCEIQHLSALTIVGSREELDPTYRLAFMARREVR
jgi:hypothetical protein